MIVLDTNVISELMRGAEASPEVRAWLNAQDAGALFLAAITVAELRFGIDALPPGRRRAGLQARADASLALFGPRVLPFTAACGAHYGRLMAQARASGLAIRMADGLIAATAAEQGFAVATRDTSPFRAAGLRVIDPWSVRTGPSRSPSP